MTSHDHHFPNFSKIAVFWPKFWGLTPWQGMVYMPEYVGAIGTKIQYQKVKNNHQ